MQTFDCLHKCKGADLIVEIKTIGELKQSATQ